MDETASQPQPLPRRQVTAGRQAESISRFGLCALILGVYVASFLLPVSVDSRGEWQLGSDVFVQLAVLAFYLDPAILFREGTVVWFANPALWLGTVLLARSRLRAATIIGAVALLLAIAAAFYFDRQNHSSLSRMFGNGRDFLLVGYYVWLAAILLLPAGTFLVRRRFRNGFA